MNEHPGPHLRFRWPVAADRVIAAPLNEIWNIISIFPHAIQHLPIVIRWVPHLKTIRPQLKRYLDSVVRGLDWFVSMGEPAARNQFGGHPWSSPPVDQVEDANVV